MNIAKNDRERFYSHISFGIGRDACWTWMGGISMKDGRGRFWVDGETRAAPVVSYVIHKGEIADELFVCHECDNPSCVNPRHLFLGTTKDNVADMISKGRKVVLKGEKASRSKLSNADATKIRELVSGGMKSLDVAKMFGVHPTTVSYVVTGKTFRNM